MASEPGRLQEGEMAWYRSWPGAMLAAGLLLAQVGMIVDARFSAARYFCWAPHDSQAEYTIDVRIGGRALSREEVAARYRMPWGWRNPRAMEHVLRVVQQYESTYGDRDHAQVLVQYRINGGPENVWKWPLER